MSSYYTLGNHAANIATSSSVRDAHDLVHWFLLEMPVVPGLLFFHSLYAAERVNAMTGGRQFWFKSYVLTIFAAFGGSTLANICANQPPPLFTVASNFMLSYITVAWYVIDQSRALRSFLRLRPISAIMAFGATAAKARAIFAFIDNFIVKYPGAMAGAIALGGLSGSGGLLFISLEKKARHGFTTPSELSSPGWGFKSAYLAAGVYYLVTDPEGILVELAIPVKYSVARDTARYALSMFLCAHAAIETLAGRHLNPLYYFEMLFYAITRVRREPVMVQDAALSAATEASTASATASQARTGKTSKNGSLRQRGKNK